MKKYLIFILFLLPILLVSGCEEEEKTPDQPTGLLPETLPDSFLFKLSWGPIDAPGFIFDIRPDSGMYLSMADTSAEFHVFRPDISGFQKYFAQIRGSKLFQAAPPENSPGVLAGHLLIILPDTGYIFPLADTLGEPFPESAAIIAAAEVEAFRQISLAGQEIKLGFKKGKKNSKYENLKISVSQVGITDVFRAFDKVPESWHEPVFVARDSAVVYVEAMEVGGELWEWEIRTKITEAVKGLSIVLENDEIELYIE